MPQLLIMKQDRGSHKKGDIVEVRACNTPFGGLEVDAFVLVEIPTMPIVGWDQFNGNWKRSLDYKVVGQDLLQDGFRLQVFADKVSVSRLGKITKEDVEKFLALWKARIVSFGDNSVTFDFRIYNAITAYPFWELEPARIDAISFSEISYDQISGVHRIQADCSVLLNNPTYIERYVAGKGATIISHENKVLVFEIMRATVLAAFKRDIQQKTEKIIARRRYYIDASAVDSIVSQGGKMLVTKTQAISYIKDKLND